MIEQPLGRFDRSHDRPSVLLSREKIPFCFFFVFCFFFFFLELESIRAHRAADASKGGRNAFEHSPTNGTNDRHDTG